MILMSKIPLVKDWMHLITDQALQQIVDDEGFSFSKINGGI
jgi:hypothetical protein